MQKTNPTQRLDEAYSLTAREKRREEAQQNGQPKKKNQKSKRLGRVSTAEKLARATLEEYVWPFEYSVPECTWRYSRTA
ncbi:MAG TPA: hypothetical protein PLY87_18350 [Planctomycetaceae bacterium]|nr:hypothetical protein [Planctomycetaceae bacterium]